MNCSDSTGFSAEEYSNRAVAEAPLAGDAGVPFEPPTGTDAELDPITEWLGLMDVVQMLCPVWPVRESPMSGQHWRL